MGRSRSELRSTLTDFTWNCWLEFGVPGWDRRRMDRYIDPEALLFLTASVGRYDHRLRDESLDWCSTNPHLLSRSRSRTFSRSWPDVEGWKDYADSLGRATGRPWPGGSSPERRVKRAGKSRLELEGRSSVLALRLRSVMGVGARSEAVRVLMLAAPGLRLLAAEIAQEAAYTKRNVADALDSLRAAGFISAVEERNAVTYQLARRRELEHLFGPVPPDQAGSFFALARALWVISDAVDRFADAPESVRSVEVRNSVLDASTDVRRAALSPPELPPQVDAWERTSVWAHDVIDSLSGPRLRKARSAG